MKAIDAMTEIEDACEAFLATANEGPYDSELTDRELSAAKLHGLLSRMLAQVRTAHHPMGKRGPRIKGIGRDAQKEAGQVKSQNRKRAPHIRGICRDAQALRVSRQHLWCVLTSRREREPLLKRYRELQRNKKAE